MKDLPGGTDQLLTDLAAGTYDVVATATDRVGNVDTDTTADELTIRPAGPVLLGDRDGNGCVNTFDLAIILNVWRQHVPPADPLDDLTGDGTINTFDLAGVLNERGRCAQKPVTAQAPPAWASLRRSAPWVDRRSASQHAAVLDMIWLEATRQRQDAITLGVTNRHLAHSRFADADLDRPLDSNLHSGVFGLLGA